jgi:peptidoglycan/xylan/chitin deacetylase (PgdA/CDA1 family)
MSRKNRPAHKAAKAREKDRQRRAEARKERRRRKDAKAKAPTPSHTRHSTSRVAVTPAARPPSTPPAAAPALTSLDQDSGSRLRALAPHGSPAVFDEHPPVHGPVTSPADFGDSHQLAGPLAGPAEFTATVSVHGDVSAPASFDAPAPPGAPATPAPLANPSAPARALRTAESARPPRPLDSPRGGSLAWRFVGWVALAGVLTGAGVAAVAVSTRPPPRPVVVPPPPPPEPTYARLHAPITVQPTLPDYAPLPAQPRVAVLRGAGDAPKVALTFDACSTPRFVGWEERVAEVLERFDVPATFFMGGRLVRERPELAQRLADNPLFDLQNHTYLHPHLPEIPASRVVTELQQTDRAVFEATGRRAYMFRPPFGEYSTEVVSAATAAGYLPIQFDVASGDPDPNFHWGRIVESVVTQVRPGSIVVMHANGHGFHTAAALPLLIETLRERGYTLTTVGDVLGAGAWVTDDGRLGPRRKLPSKAGESASRATPGAAASGGSSTATSGDTNASLKAAP